ncbi:MAG: hypothetical protein M1828_005772 [Chrysothrix sp. TS-e1954]|nr:MAG: hypothetical protein M1828_005772 [Chrysothrix sp. TS-e1954]
MAQPLSPRSDSSLNAAPPASNSPYKNSPLKSELRQSSAQSDNTFISVNSSPFQTEVASQIGKDVDMRLDFDDSPHKSQSQGPKITSPSKSSSPGALFDIFDETSTKLPQTDTVKLSPRKQRQTLQKSHSRSPSKSTMPQSSPTKSPDKGAILGYSVPSPSLGSSVYTPAFGNDENDQDTRSVLSDDTCFSNFSAVPNADMTLFAKLGNTRSPARSPTRRNVVPDTPGSNMFHTPSTSKRRQLDESRPSSRGGSPTPRNPKFQEGETTSLLLDFTQMESMNRGKQSPPKSTTEPNLLSYINNKRMPSPAKTPSSPSKRNMLNLLDFDLPPQPTPRSIPTITIRELESLKSNYLSEISSLKASLMGREAEVSSLKKAVSDAERRVGEAMETLREEKSAREYADNERLQWEKKGKEVETVLKSVREEYLIGEREKDDLQAKLEESNRAREEAELKAAEASRTSMAQSQFDPRSSGASSNTDAVVAQKVAQQLDEKMENLARELHAVYKKKHEGKVATLKKTYETRADKRCHELQASIDDLSKQLEELQATKESSLSLELPKHRVADIAKYEEQKTEIQQSKAKIAGLEEEMNSVRGTHSRLLQELEQERVEKGELVAAVDEMLALQSEVGAPSAIEDFRKSISRPSGLRGPGFGESRIGRGGPGAPQRSTSNGTSGKSRMMSNIERMGSGRAID